MIAGSADGTMPIEGMDAACLKQVALGSAKPRGAELGKKLHRRLRCWQAVDKKFFADSGAAIASGDRWWIWRSGGRYVGETPKRKKKKLSRKGAAPAISVAAWGLLRILAGKKYRKTFFCRPWLRFDQASGSAKNPGMPRAFALRPRRTA